LNPIPEDQLPDAMTAKEIYEEVYTNGRLTTHNPFGEDPLDGREDLKALRQTEFEQLYPLNRVFGECANEKPRLFQQAVLSFIDITARLYLTL